MKNSPIQKSPNHQKKTLKQSNWNKSKIRSYDSNRKDLRFGIKLKIKERKTY